MQSCDCNAIDKVLLLRDKLFRLESASLYTRSFEINALPSQHYSWQEGRDVVMEHPPAFDSIMNYTYKK